MPDDFPTIQGALNAAANGDTIIVRAGLFTERIDFLGKAVILTSEEGPATTTIDGAELGSVVTFQSGETAATILNGFTITNGQASNGGGISCIGSSPTITKNVITANTALLIGAGVYCENSSPTISENDISGNRTDDRGGGIGCELVSAPAITENRIEENAARYCGGGVNCDHGAAPLISGNLFRGNAADAFGAAILADEAAPVITSNRFYENIARQSGGAVYMHESNCRIDNNLLVGNEAILFGGGIVIDGPSKATLSNNTIVGNRAGIYGGGLHLWDASVTTVVNTILWKNSASNGPQISLLLWTRPPTLNIDYSDVEDGPALVFLESGCVVNWGSSMIDSDPRFVDAAGEDFHLTILSPCRDAGAGSIVTEPLDFEGDPRIALGNVDMGADEFWYHLYHIGDVIAGSPIEIKVAGYPAAPVTLFLGSGIADPPYTTQHGDFWLNWPPLWQGSIGRISRTGVLTVPATVPPGWAPGSQRPLQALVGPVGGARTRLSTLQVLEVA